MVTMATTAAWPDRTAAVWTHALVDALPDDGMRHELIDGVLLVSPSPVPRHQRAVTRLWARLATACPPDQEVFVAPLDWRPDDRTSLEPDVLVVPASALSDTCVTGTPTLVVEVLSPSTARIDRTVKLARYAEGGIAQYWVVDPGSAGGDPPRIEVYDLVSGSFRLQAAATGQQPLQITGLLEIALAPDDLVRQP